VQHLLLGNTKQTANGVTTRPGPTLDLNFAASLNTVDQVSGENLVTFNRSTSGTYFDSAGVLRSAAVNLLLRSEEFDNPAAWGALNAYISADATTAPNGTTTADKIAASGGANEHSLRQEFDALSGATYTFSCYLKASELSVFSLAFRVASLWPSSSNQVVNFDLTAGTLTVLSGTPTASIVNVGNGWWRCSITQTTVASGTAQARIQSIYDSDGSGIYLWGAQLEIGSVATPYIPTTSAINSAPRFDHDPTTGESLGLLVEEQRTNLWLWSNSAVNGETWNNTIFTSTAGEPDPAGGTSAILASDINNATGGTYYQRTNVASLSAGTTVSYSIFIKPIDIPISFVQLSMFSNGTTDNCSASFVTSGTTFTGEINPSQGGTGSVVSTKLETLSNGWYRLSLTGIVSTVTQSDLRTRINLGNYTRVAGTPRFVWYGAQLEAGAFPTSYIPTTGAEFTRSADLASITGSNFGVTRTNLLSRSEEFEDSAWNSAAGARTVTANAVVAPDGTIAADLIAANGTNAPHLVSQTVTLSNIPYAYSVYIKAGTNNFAQLRGFSPFGSPFANFNISSGTVGSTGGTATGSAITDAGNGWFRCTMFFTPSSSTSSIAVYIVSSATAGTGEINNLATSIYVWGAQLETGSVATAYIPSPSVFVSRASSGTYFDSAGVLRSATTNLLLQSEDLNLAFTPQNSTTTPNVVTAPNNTITADLSVPNTNALSHASYKTGFSLIPSTNYAFSVFVKAREYNTIQLTFTSGFNNLNAWANFILSGNGSVGFTGTSGTAAIESFANDWYRVSLISESGASASSGGPVVIVLDSDRNARDPSFAGDNTSGAFIWGAQFEQSGTVGGYVPTTSTINSAPRFDHDPVSLISKGLLLEEQRTNLLLRSEEADSPQWNIPNSSITVDPNVTVSPDGSQTADKVKEATTTGGHTIEFTGFAFQSGTIYTVSFYAKAAERSRFRVTWPIAFTNRLAFVDISPGGYGVISDGGTVISVSPAGNDWFRVVSTSTCTTTTTGARAGITLVDTGTNVNYTGDGNSGIYIWGAQLEAGDFATSYIPTTTAAVTRSADISTSAATTVFENSWYNALGGTCYTECRPVLAPTAVATFSFNDTTSSNRVTQFSNVSQFQGGRNTAGAGVLFTPSATPILSSATNKAALAFANLDVALAANGGTVGTASDYDVPVVTRLEIGQQLGAGAINGTIKRLTYYPIRLPNSLLQVITI
jgi:hypothetical protein